MFKPVYVAGICLAVALLLVYFSFNPALNTYFPKCPMHTLFGIDCPGCGSQRAIHALLHGEIYRAIDYNLLLVLSIPLLLVHFCCKVMTILTGKNYELKFLSASITPKIIGLLVVLFWIARNISVDPFSFLAA